MVRGYGLKLTCVLSNLELEHLEPGFHGACRMDLLILLHGHWV